MKHSLPWKWKYSVPIAALTLSLVLPALLAAALITERTGSDASVLSQVDSELLVGLIDAPVDLFNSPEVLWQGKTDTTRLTAPELLPFDGQTALEGSRSLLIEEASYRTSYGASLLYSFPDPLPDYTAHPTCTLSVFLPSEGSYSLTLTLRSSFIDAEQSHHRLTYEKTVRVSGYGWQTVLFDVSAFQGRSSVRELEISVKSDEAVYGQPFSVALDAVGFCSSPAPLQALRFLSDAYQPEDCTIRCEERMTVSATGSGASFSATSLPALTLGEDTALCVSLINHGGFRTLSCRYGSEGAISRTVSHPLESNTQSIQYCYFPLSGEELSNLSFTLSGGDGGDVTILGISLQSYPVFPTDALASDPVGALTECRLEPSRADLTVSGTLSARTLQEYASGRLELYRLSLSQTVSDLAAGQATLLATQPLSSSFVFSVSAASEALTSSYAVAVRTARELIPLSPPIHVSNPELLAAHTVTLPEVSGKKGFAPIDQTSALDGIAYTAIPVPLEQLLTLDRNAYAHEVDGQKTYYRTDFLSELDRSIALCRDRGIHALLVLTVSAGEDAALNRILLHPDADPDAAYCAFNTVTAQGSATLRAAVDLLCRRYAPSEGDKGGVIGLCVGRSVNRAGENYSLGRVTLTTFVRHYAAALRLVRNTADAVCPALQVYASLDYDWSTDSGRRTTDRFGSRQTLDLLGQILSLGGDFDWQLCFDPYPSASFLAFEQGEKSTSFAASTVTLSNPEVLTSYLARSALTYERRARSVILLEQHAPFAAEGTENERIRRSADYAAGYYKICTRNLTGVKALIVSHDVGYNNTLRYIDTDRSLTVTAYAPEVLGITDWSAHLTAFDPDSVVARRIGESRLTHAVPSSVVGRIALWRFEEASSADAWKCGPGTLSLTGGVTLGEGSYLSAVLDGDTAAGHEFSVRPSAPLDFTLTPYLSFDCFLTGLSGVEEMSLTVAVYSGRDCLLAEGILPEGDTTCVVVDLTAFAGRNSVDGIRFLLHSRDAEERIGTPTLLLGQIDGLSEQYAGEELKDQFEKDQNRGEEGDKESRLPDMRAVVLLGAVILIGVTLEILHVLLRARQAEG